MGHWDVTDHFYQGPSASQSDRGSSDSRSQAKTPYTVAWLNCPSAIPRPISSNSTETFRTDVGSHVPLPADAIAALTLEPSEAVPTPTITAFLAITPATTPVTPNIDDVAPNAPVAPVLVAPVAPVTLATPADDELYITRDIQMVVDAAKHMGMDTSNATIGQCFADSSLGEAMKLPAAKPKGLVVSMILGSALL